MTPYELQAGRQLAMEIVSHPEVFTLFFSSLAFAIGALSFKQRQWVLDRDGHQCQATAPHRCNDYEGLEADHLIPQAWMYAHGQDPDFPENILLKCKVAHDLHHPERTGIRRLYHKLKAQGRDVFKEMHEDHQSKARSGVVFWDSSYDESDKARAKKLTQEKLARGSRFPEKKTRSKHEPTA